MYVHLPGVDQWELWQEEIIAVEWERVSYEIQNCQSMAAQVMDHKTNVNPDSL
jgi:hypothetical protein